MQLDTNLSTRVTPKVMILLWLMTLESDDGDVIWHGNRS